MKRPLFIIIGIVFVAVLLAIWIYVLFFGSPENGDGMFTDLGFGDTTDPTVIVDGGTGGEEQPVVDVTGPDRLRQLTTKRVIGYEEVRYDASSTPMIHFAEAGTGHMYSINLSTGEEKRISATTIPTSNQADFTQNGRYVMIKSGQGSRAEHLVGLLSTSSDSLSTRVIDANIIDFTSTADNTFLYAVQTNSTVDVREYYPISDTSDLLFTIPFREASIYWGETGDGTHYVYPKASTVLEGFALKATNGFLERIPADGYGFSISGNDDFALFSKQSDDEYKTYTYNASTEEVKEFSVDTIPEKCTFFNDVASGGICAQTLTEYDHLVPDSWYKGMVKYSDNLWEVDLEFGSATLLLDTVGESGRQVDMINIELNPSNEVLYFQNKNDYSLWLFERIRQQ